jgi:2-hydroxy-3-oxopropionate reductase
MKKIGFIGLGIMGKPMAKNLLAKGFPLYFYTRKPLIEEEFVKAGGIACASPKELAPLVDVIITMVTNTHDVEEVLFGKEGAIHTAKPSCVVIDMSTISATHTKKIAEKLQQHDIEMLDAPVSGGEQGAINGTLSIMVGGKEEILKKVHAILATLGKQIIHIGDHGAGQTAKACNQIIIAETIVAVDEALRLAKRSGVDPAKVREALLGGFASSRVLEVHGKRMLEGDYAPGFKASLHRKDMHLALDEAHHANVYIPAAKYATQCIDQLVMKGHSQLDSSAIHLLSEE